MVQGRRRLGIMKRNGAELMRRWEERQWMCGRWTKRSRRIFMRLLKEVNRGLVKGGGEEEERSKNGFFLGKRNVSGGGVLSVGDEHRVV